MDVDSRPVVPFDHHSTAFSADASTTIRQLRARCPVTWTEAHGGYWVINGYRDVAAAFRDHATFSSAQGATIPDLSFGSTHIPVTVDPPQQQVFRRILNPTFSKESVRKLEPAVRELVHGLVTGMAERRSWDFVDDLSSVVPGTVMLMILGMAPERRTAFATALQRGMQHQGTTDPQLRSELEADRVWMVDQIRAEIAARRGAHDAPDGLMTHLVTATLPDGHPLTDAEIVDIVMVLFVAGFHTTNSALASIVVHLDAHPADRQRLIDAPELIPAAIEELMRVYAPSTGMARTVTADVTFGDVTMQTGEKAYLFTMAANRDPSVFPEPEAVDLTRTSPGRPSLAWGWGVHRCLGIHLARMLLALEVGAILEIMPGYELDRERTRLADDIGIAYAYEAVPGRLDAAGAPDGP